MFSRFSAKARDMHAMRSLIFPLEMSGFTRLHRKGAIPFWMRPEARDARPGEGSAPPIGLRDPVRILHDNGHDIWIFLSARGLEIRSFYLVPRIFTNPGISSRRLGVEPFDHIHTELHTDLIDWDALLPEGPLSAHERLRKTMLISSLPEHPEQEVSFRSTLPITFVQLRECELHLQIGTVPVSVRLLDRRATEISTLSPGACPNEGRCLLGASLTVAPQARRLSFLANSLTLRQRLSLQLEKWSAAGAAPTPFPSP